MTDLLQQLSQTTLAFFALFIFTRLLGKQQISQLTYFDYINGITIGSIAAVIATDEKSLIWEHTLDLFLFSLLTALISIISLKNRPLRKYFQGEPTIVIHNGKILEKNLSKARYNMDDLLLHLRQKNIFDLADVEYALLEPNGQISVLPKSQKRPLTPQDLNIPTKYEGLSPELIMDGKIIHQNLRQLNLDESWLKEQLASRGYHDLKEVVYASLDSSGNLYIDQRKDDGVPMMDVTDDPNEQNTIKSSKNKPRL